MSLFHESCKKLTDAGILPQTVIDVARATSCSHVITQAFPSVPPQLRENLLLGRCNITFSNQVGWHFEYVKQLTLA